MSSGVSHTCCKLCYSVYTRVIGIAEAIYERRGSVALLSVRTVKPE